MMLARRVRPINTCRVVGLPISHRTRGFASPDLREDRDTRSMVVLIPNETKRPASSDGCRFDLSMCSMCMYCVKGGLT